MSSYVPCRTLDQMYSQRSVGATPFASGKVPNTNYESANIAGIRDKKEKGRMMDCKMTYPMSLRSSHELKHSIHQPRSDTNFFVNNDEAEKMHVLPQKVSDSAQPANIYWQSPPVVFEEKPNDLHGSKKLPRDTFHPLLSALQASENAKAAQFTPQAAYLANASRKGPPCPAHQVQNNQTSQFNNAPRGGDGTLDETLLDPDMDDPSSPAGGGKHQKYPRKGDTKTAVGRAYNSEGGFHDPDQYASKIIEFATTQPTSLTAIAAKALASAIHDKPSHSIPHNVSRSRAQKPIPNSGPSGTNANLHQYAGLGDTKNIIVPPSAAFRGLSQPLRATLSKRERDCRHKVGDILTSTYPPIQPPASQAEEKIDVSEVNHENQTFTNRKAPHVDEDDDEEMDYISDGETDPISALGRSSRLAVWQIAIQRKASRKQVSGDEERGAHVVENATAGKKMRVLTPSLVSMHSTLSSRAQISTYLNGVGIKMENSLSQAKPPSQSSFCQNPEKLHTTKQFTNIASTPCNSFCFDDERLEMLLSDKGEEVDDIFLEGCSHLKDSTIACIARFCPNLKLLNLADCNQLSDKTLMKIGQNCKQLAYLNISGCEQVSGAGITVIMENCPNLYALCASGLPLLDQNAAIAFTRTYLVKQLSVLDLSYCVNLTDEALVCVAQHCRGLEMLDISGCRSIGDVGVGSIGSSCSCMKVLKLKLCSQLTPASLKTLTKAARNLVSLDVSGCVAINPATLTTIVSHMPCAQSLAIGGCPLLDDSAVQAITRYCKGLKALNLSSCVGVSLASCMELIHELSQLRKLIVSESSISNAEVVMLSALRESCKIVRNQFREQPAKKYAIYKMAEPKKKKKEEPKKKK